jgi:hypothetical protein
MAVIFSFLTLRKAPQQALAAARESIFMFLFCSVPFPAPSWQGRANDSIHSPAGGLSLRQLRQQLAKACQEVEILSLLDGFQIKCLYSRFSFVC